MSSSSSIITKTDGISSRSFGASGAMRSFAVAPLCLIAREVFLSSNSDSDAKSKKSAWEGVGETPLIYLKSVSEATGRRIYGKAEYMNPTGSVKDRAAKQMLLEAEQKGLIKPGSLVTEGTGGNTGVALAWLGRERGYKCILTMPKTIAKEKVEMARSLGATVELCELVPVGNPKHYASRAKQLAEENDGLHTNQFANLANFRSHYLGTGPEIFDEMAGNVDAFVTAAGTGGTVAGISAYLATKGIPSWLVDPHGSILYSYVSHHADPSQVQQPWIKSSEGSSTMEGIGISIITENFKGAKLCGAVRTSDQEATEMAHYLRRNEGLYLGPSAALNVVGAVKVARTLPEGATVVTILCDGGERYESKTYNVEWLKENGLVPKASGAALDFVSD